MARIDHKRNAPIVAYHSGPSMSFRKSWTQHDWDVAVINTINKYSPLRIKNSDEIWEIEDLDAHYKHRLHTDLGDEDDFEPHPFDYDADPLSIYELFRRYGIKMSLRFVGYKGMETDAEFRASEIRNVYKNKNDLTQPHYVVTLYHDVSENYPYKTHRETFSFYYYGAHADILPTNGTQTTMGTHTYLVIPTLGDIMYSILSDLQTYENCTSYGDEPLANFLEEFGYDDEREGIKTWNAVKRNCEDLYTFLDNVDFYSRNDKWPYKSSKLRQTILQCVALPEMEGEVYEFEKEEGWEEGE